MRKALGTFVLGLVGGWLLSRLRAMPGGDLVDWPLAPAGTGMAWRATALILLGVALWKTREGLRATLLLAVAAGFALQGFVAGPRHGTPWVGLVVAGIAAWIGASWVRTKSAPAPPPEGAHAANPGEMAGIFVAGGGVAIALEAIARHVRPFGSGLAQDDTAFALAFLAFLALGAGAFGWIASARALQRLSFPVLLAATAASCFVSLALIDVLTDHLGLASFTRRFGLRAVDRGTLGWDLLIGAGAFVLPSLLLGAALAGARGRRALTCLVLGAACGLLAVPRMFGGAADAQATDEGMYSAQLVPIGTLIAAAGAALAILSESRRRPAARWAAVAIALACLLPMRTPEAIFVIAPWDQRLIAPYLVVDTGHGLATVEPSPGGLKVATLERRMLTPALQQAAADVQRLRDAFALLSDERRAEGGIEVLFVGQLSPLRAYHLALLGAARIDRSAAWWEVMPRLEHELFVDDAGNMPVPLPDGEVLAPDDACARLDDGRYDLVIAAPGSADAPAVERLEAPASTVLVRWLSLEQPLRGIVGAETAVLSAHGLEMPALGIVTNAPEPDGELGLRLRRIESSPWDQYAPTPLAWSLTREMNRADKARAAAFRAILAGWRPTPPPFARGLEAHYAAQVPSSPYENEAQRVEISDDALEPLALDARAGLDDFTRRMWEWIAQTLVGKRDVERIDRWIGPLAAAHAPWPELEVPLAYADLEGLDAPAAIERLERVVAGKPASASAWFALGEAREIAGDAQGATAAFKQAHALLPADERVRRRLAMAACRSGDPLGRVLAQEIVSANPKDEEMQAYLEPGPPPPAPTAYQPEH